MKGNKEMSQAVDQKKLDEFMEQVKKVEKGHKLDLSSDEDLSIGVMNLISIEEHLFFTAKKTGDDSYFSLLAEIREMRKELLKKLIKEYDGEVWCISKHLLASSMRLMEVGTKALATQPEEAQKMFEKSYRLYNLFWALNLNLVSKDKASAASAMSKKEKAELSKEMVEDEMTAPAKASNGWWSKLGTALNKALDCCRE